MAFSRLSLAFSLLLFSSLVIASAGDYGIPADSPQAKPEGQEKPHYYTQPVDKEKAVYDKKAEAEVYKPKPKPEGEQKPSYDAKQDKPKPEEKSEEKEKPSYNRYSYVVKPKPEEEKSSYGTKPDDNKAKPEEKSDYDFKPKTEDKAKPKYDRKPYVVKPEQKIEEKPNYGTKPEEKEDQLSVKPNYDSKQDKPKPEEKSEEKEKPSYNRYSYVVKPKPEEEKRSYGTKPDDNKAKPEEKSDYDFKPKTEDKAKPKYDRKPYVVKPEQKIKEKPYYGTKPEEKEHQLSVAVEGLVLCKSGSNYYPIKGAFATITCKAVDEAGAEKTVSVCSEATDEKGYYFATLSQLTRDKLTPKECKAYLKSSPLQTCNIATNVNKATEGALLSVFRVLQEKKMKLYSVRPFFYTSEAQAAAQYGY